MNEASPVACSMTAGSASIAETNYRDASRSLLRWIVFGAASIALFALAIAHSGSVGAQAPIYTTPVTTVATNTTTGYPANAVISTYVDPRYCNGIVSVVTDSTGHLIDVCPATGQRIYPVFPDYGYGSYLGGNYLGSNYLNGNVAFNGNYAFNGGYPYNGNFSYLNGNTCGFTYCNTLNTFPAGGTVYGGTVFYNDNRFCGDGKIAFVPGRGYFCQNGGPLVTNGVNNVNCGNFFLNGCGIWRGYEVDTTAPATQPQQVTAYAATAAKAPVVAPAAPVVAPAAPVVAPAAPVVAPAAVTALNAPVAAPVGSSVDFSDRG